MELPVVSIPDDRGLSPHTGYTRRHWLAITEELVRGVMRYVGPDGVPVLPADPDEPALPAQLRNPGGAGEAFDRTHLLMAVYLRATGKTRVPGCAADIAELYRRGMAVFHRSDSPRFDWRRGAAATCLAALLAPVHFLDGLDTELREHFAAHLARFIHRPSRDCNTLLFSMMPAPALDRLGVAYDRALLDDYFERILAMHRGDGWFIDGWNGGFDSYNLWGFQLYLHALMTYDDRWRAKHGERVREITRLHEQTLPFLFGSDGGPVPKGRSLNYRFAVNSGIGYAQLSGLSGMSPGLARRIASGALRYFRDRGCISSRGLLEPGYRGVNAAVGEDYTDRGAPYWAATGLVALALPEEHPFWTAREEPLPSDGRGVSRRAVPGARMILKADGRRGEARQLVLGEPFLHQRVWQAGSKYYQQGYSSALGYALAGDLGPELAAGRTGVSADGAAWALRTRPEGEVLDDARGRGSWSIGGVIDGMEGEVVTESFLLDDGEVHVFWHTAPGPLFLTVGGWSVRLEHGEQPRVESSGTAATVTSGEMWSVLRVLAGPPGRFAVEEVRPRPGFRHAHLFEGWAAFPRWASLGPVTPGAKVAVFVDAALREKVPVPRAVTAAAGEEPPGVFAVRAEGRRWQVR